MSLAPSVPAGLGSSLFGGTSNVTWKIATTSGVKEGEDIDPEVLVLRHGHQHPDYSKFEKAASNAAGTIVSVNDTNTWASIPFDKKEKAMAGMLNRQLKGVFSINGTLPGHTVKLVSTDADGKKELKEWSDDDLESGFQEWITAGGEWPLDTNSDGTEAKNDGTEAKQTDEV